MGGRQVRLIKSQHFDVILREEVPNELEVSRNMKAKEAKVLFVRVRALFREAVRPSGSLSAPGYFTDVET